MDRLELAKLEAKNSYAFQAIWKLEDALIYLKMFLKEDGKHLANAQLMLDCMREKQRVIKQQLKEAYDKSNIVQ